MATVDGLDDKVRERYLEDPFFHAAVHCYMQASGQRGYADDDGVPHSGPTVSVVKQVVELEEAWKSIGFPNGTLTPIENMALTIALSQIERGIEVPSNTTAALIFALARTTGRPDHQPGVAPEDSDHNGN